jgi:DNA ligase (NAD+)
MIFCVAFFQSKLLPLHKILVTMQQRIAELRQLLNYHNHKYYVENAPEIDDITFDGLMRELQDLEQAHPEWDDPDSPTHRVGSDLTREFQSVEHLHPMLSLSKAQRRVVI